MNTPLAQATAECTRGRRAKPRARVALTATIECLSGQRRVLLRDVSETGALIEGTDLPGLGTDLIVRCGDIDVLATVVRVERNKCGLAFDEPANNQQIVRLRMESDRIAATGETPEQMQAARDWRFGHVR